MGKNLYIAEKPSVGMEFVKALGIKAGKKQDGYIEGDNDIVTWCYGHLIEMSYPESYDPDLKQWKMEDLPFIPAKYKYEVIKESAKQYKTVSSLLNRKDVSRIYYAGDSAREGEYIQRLVREKGGYNHNAEEYRVWIDSQTKDEILRGIREAKPLSAYDNLSDSAYARAIEDYLIGMNFSRVLSLRYAGMVSKYAGDGKYHAIAVGRVMSCVLGMVVSRERAIRNTRVVTYYTIQADLGSGLKADWHITEKSRFKNTPENYNDIGLLDKIPVEELLEKLSEKNILTLVDINKTTVRKAAPLLFNLAELQAECTKVLKISPSDTLAIAQSLYEKKMTTYPRTDARVLTTAITKAYRDNIDGLKAVSELSDVVSEILSSGMYKSDRMDKTKYVDDSKVSDHYAIIPTGQGISQIDSLSDQERKVYMMIAKRFLSIFYPAAEYEKISFSMTAEGEMFEGSATRLVKPGYLKVAGYTPKPNEDSAFQVAESLNGAEPAAFELRTGKSKPPQRYTSGSMILAMENAGNLIEDPELREQIRGSGIGTSATRADVIKKLAANRYIKVDGKTQVISPAPLGEAIYEVLLRAVPNILNPAYTASWEKGLQGIVDGKVTKDYYLDKIYGYVRNGVREMKEKDHGQEVSGAIQNLKDIYPEIGKASERTGSSGSTGTGLICPICGKPISHNKRGYYCTGYKDGCKFSLFDTLREVKITEAILADLISSWESDGKDAGHSGTSKEISGFKSKEGKRFPARIRITKQPGEYAKYEFIYGKQGG